MGKPRRFLTEDFKQISEWMSERSLGVPRGTRLSSTGIIVDNVAAGFLYVTNSEVAIIDCFISNPKADKIDRGNALDEITEALLKLALRYGARIVKCDSQLPSIQERALRHGFTESGTYSSFSKEL